LLVETNQTHCFSGNHIIETLMGHLIEFTGEAGEQEDDITLVYLERIRA